LAIVIVLKAIIPAEDFFKNHTMKSKAHTCPECGEKLPFSAFLFLPGEFRIECPFCKSQLLPALSDFHKVVPWIIVVLIIFTAINQKAGFTVFLVYAGVLTLLAYLILIVWAYFFVSFKKKEDTDI